MNKRTTDDWKALLGTQFPERLWVEESDWDDEAWDVCFQHPDWGTRASIGSTHSEEVAHLFAASHESASEVVRLREALEELQALYIKADYPNGDDWEKGKEHAYRRVLRDLTHILEGTHDDHA